MDTTLAFDIDAGDIEKWQREPGLGFPKVFGDDAELEGAYRFFGNPTLSFERLLEPHFSATAARCSKMESEILVAHDTSTFVFTGEREGLGFINKNNRGFLGHVSLAMAPCLDGEAALPLGSVAASAWIPTKSRKDKTVSQHALRESGESESLRWLQTAQDAERRFGPEAWAAASRETCNQS